MITLNPSNIENALVFDNRDAAFYIHPRDYFRLKNVELCLAAEKQNERHGRDIWDKRTKGWKLIKVAYTDFVYGNQSNGTE